MALCVHNFIYIYFVSAGAVHHSQTAKPQHGHKCCWCSTVMHCASCTVSAPHCTVCCTALHRRVHLGQTNGPCTPFLCSVVTDVEMFCGPYLCIIATFIMMICQTCVQLVLTKNASRDISDIHRCIQLFC